MHFDQTFWVGVSFLLFIALVWKPISRLLMGALDGRAERIQKELDEALRLKEEAQSLLATYQEKQKELLDEAEQIVRHAEEESKRIITEAEKNLEESLNKRIEMSMQKIASHEASILQDVHNNMVDVTMGTVRSLVSEYLDKDASDELLNQAIEGINKKLH